MYIFNDIGIYGYVFICCSLFVFVYLVSAVYRCILLCSREKNIKQGSEEGISVVITVHNRAYYLKEHLEYFFKQNYPLFEIIIVDECSEDNTQDILSDMRERYQNIHTTRIFPGTKFRNTKKLAIHLGILAAKYDKVLFADITCKPASEDWIATMGSYFTDGTAVIVGYANYDVKRRADIPRFFRFYHYLETIFLIKNKSFVTGEGCNMGCRKQLYLSQKVFSKNSQNYTGYDSEIIKALSKKGTVKVVKEKNAMMLIVEDTKKKWMERMSHYYYNKHKRNIRSLILSDYDVFLRLIIYVMSIWMIFNRVLIEYALSFVILTFFTNCIVINICSKSFKQRKLLLISLIISFVGFAYRWYYNMHSIFIYKKWR